MIAAEGDDDGDARFRQGGGRERHPEPVERAEFPRQNILNGRKGHGGRQRLQPLQALAQFRREAAVPRQDLSQLVQRRAAPRKHEHVFRGGRGRGERGLFGQCGRLMRRGKPVQEYGQGASNRPAEMGVLVGKHRREGVFVDEEIPVHHRPPDLSPTPLLQGVGRGVYHLVYAQSRLRDRSALRKSIAVGMAGPSPAARISARRRPMEALRNKEVWRDVTHR